MATIYYDVLAGRRVTSTGALNNKTITLGYQSAPTWEIQLSSVDTDAGTVTGLDLTAATAWKAAVDKDFNHTTDPMCRILDADIDSSQAAAIAYGVAQGYPAIPNRWDSVGSNWHTVSDYPVTPWVRHMYKLTTTNWEWWSDNSWGYANEVVSLVCVNEPKVRWTQNTSSQYSFDMNLGDEENPNWITVYYGTRCCYEYLGLMSFGDGVAEIGASIETLMWVVGENNSFLPAFYCGVSVNWYMPSAPLGTTCPSPAAHLVLTGQLQFVDSRGCALAPILECPTATPATAIGYVIYDANENLLATGSLSLNGGRQFAIRLNPNLESSMHLIKLLFTLDESDRTFNSFVYKVNSVKINNTATPKLDGTYSYTMEIPATHSLGTIEVFRRYIIKTT